MPTGNQHLIRGPPLMWREGGTRLSGEERNFTSLSLYLPPPSFAFFTICCASRLLAGFPVRDSKNKCMKQVRTVRRSSLLLISTAMTSYIPAREPTVSIRSQQSATGYRHLLTNGAFWRLDGTSFYTVSLEFSNKKLNFFFCHYPIHVTTPA